MFTFPSLAAYETYRQQSMQETCSSGCDAVSFSRYEKECLDAKR